VSELHVQLAEINRALGNIEGTVNSIKESMERGTERMDGHDTRLSRVEIKQSHQAGANSVISAITGAIAGGIATWLAKHFA